MPSSHSPAPWWRCSTTTTPSPTPGCIDDADVLRAGSSAAVLGHRVMAPSTLGTFLRCFAFGHVRQLDRAAERLLGRAWAAGAGLRHCPSGRFGANAAWLAIATLAHNLLRWVATIGLGASGLLVAKTPRRRLLHLPGRLTSSARQHLLHLPTDWPWASQFLRAMPRLRAVPLRARRRAATPTPRTAGRPRASLPGVWPTRTVGAAGALRTAPARARPATPAKQTTRPTPDRRPNGGSRPPTRATVDPGLAKALEGVPKIRWRPFGLAGCRPR